MYNIQCCFKYRRQNLQDSSQSSSSKRIYRLGQATRTKPTEPPVSSNCFDSNHSITALNPIGAYLRVCPTTFAIQNTFLPEFPSLQLIAFHPLVVAFSHAYFVVHWLTNSNAYWCSLTSCEYHILFEFALSRCVCDRLPCFEAKIIFW